MFLPVALGIALVIHFTEGQLVRGGTNVCSKTTTVRQTYYTRCGFLNLSRCTRYRYVTTTDYECCNNWRAVSSTSSSCTIPRCASGWNSCPNGGTCTTANNCACIQGYFSPNCQKCTDITNCNTHACTSATNQRCVKCDYEHTHAIRAYRPIQSGAYVDRVCQKLCSWRSDSSQCYPGRCTDGTPNTCQCAPGFGGTDCMTITKTPDITRCSAVIFDSAGERHELKCDDINSATKYTNTKATRLQVDWKTQYKGLESAAGYSPPGYVNAFAVGLTSVVAEWRMPRGRGTIACNSGISTSSPSTSLRSCVDDGQLPSTIVSGDVLTLSFKSTNGGRLQITNFDAYPSRTSSYYQYYSGRTLTHTASFKFDFDPPYHCLASCASNMLDIGDPYTRKGSITITWSGWIDALSGIKLYQFEVYRLKPYGTSESTLLDYRSEAPVATGKINSGSATRATVTLPDRGLYCVILSVFDGSKEEHVEGANHRLARRFILFDNSSFIETSNNSDHQMFVQSAAANTSYQWITTLDDEVSIQWSGHFFNDLHRTNLWLNAIASHNGAEIDADYEDVTGQPPATRSMEAILNVNGITRYDITFAKDNQTGRTLDSPSSSWETVADFETEVETMTISREDGDTIRFWVKAFDVMDNTLIDDILVHVDSSPPEFVSEGITTVTGQIMNQTEIKFEDLRLDFEAYDYHSGIKKMQWELHDLNNLTLHGRGEIPVTALNETSCNNSECYCIEWEGRCSQKMYQLLLQEQQFVNPFERCNCSLTVTVINHAMLETTNYFEVNESDDYYVIVIQYYVYFIVDLEECPLCGVVLPVCGQLTECTNISNCDTHECTSETDQRCVTCDYEYTDEIRAYTPIQSGGYEDRVCQKLCSWRRDSLQCYPGNCTDGTPDTCQCAPGFGGTDCMTITETPDITSCSAVISDTDDERLNIKCDDMNSATKYTNIKATSLQVLWKTQYEGLENAADFAPPYYVNDFEVGLISAVAEWTMPGDSGTIDCNIYGPSTSLKSCKGERQLPSTTVSGDVLKLSFKSTNGGRLQITDFDGYNSSTLRSYQSYSGTTLTHTASLTFDFDPPYHCLATCSGSMLDIGNPYTREGSITITWNGWLDAVAGIRNYQYYVYKLKPYGTGESALLDYRSEDPVASGEINSLSPTHATVTLPDRGVYSVILIVFDGSNDEHVDEANHRLARRFFIFDNSSFIERSTHSDHQLFVQSAAANTSYEWITTLDEEVSIQWNGHFFNDMHRTNLWLGAIASHHGTEIDADYEDVTGQPPATRSMEAIPNVNGITRYDITFAKDHQAGRTLNSPSSSWKTVADFETEVDTMTISREDGETIRFWVKAFDVMNNTLIDDIIVHVDSSPPEFISEGIATVTGEPIMDQAEINFEDLRLDFEAYDIHSGIKNVQWQLHDVNYLNLHGKGEIPVTTLIETTCTNPECYCVESDGRCSLKLYQLLLQEQQFVNPFERCDCRLSVTVINHAMLETTNYYEVLLVNETQDVNNGNILANEKQGMNNEPSGAPNNVHGIVVFMTTLYLVMLGN